MIKTKTMPQPPVVSKLLWGKPSAIAALTVASLTSATLLTAPDPATAAIVWDYSPATTGATVVPDFRFTNVSTGQNFAEQFLLGQDTTLTGMDIYTRGVSAGQSVTVRLWSDNGGIPGTLLQTLTGALDTVDTQGAGSAPSVLRAFSNFTNPIAVLANTRYWIGMSGTSSSIGQVALTAPNAPGNGTLAQFNNTTFLGFSNNAGDQAFRLHGTPIPTPALLPGLIGMGVAAWRKRKAAVSSLDAEA